MRTGICPFCGKKVDKFIMFRGDVVGCRFCGIHAKQTNADSIRAMTDEELAEWLPFKMGACNMNEKCGNDCTCDVCWLGWLKQEATDVN